MMKTKTKIVLDSDVVIHFMKGDCFTLLLDIFPEYDYLILDIVYDELSKSHQTRTFIDNIISFMPDKLQMIKFQPTGNMLREYAMLSRSLGKGESACMIYCHDNKDVLGSSNLKDIKDYCSKHDITYLTTLDFLYYAFVRKKMSKEECDVFIGQVVSKGSKLPDVNISQYVCSVCL
ncbi:MAG: hypothetical protein ACRC6V_17460 [Bacteroidales bacterium]